MDMQILSRRPVQKWLFFLITAGVLCITTLKSPSPAFAIPYPNIVGDKQPNTLSDLEKIIANLISVAVAFAGIALFVMLIMGGLRYLSSGGDPKGMQEASHTITYAIAGIALLIVAWFALLFIQEFTGVRVTIFTAPGS